MKENLSSDNNKNDLEYITDKYTREHFYQRIYTKQKSKAIIFHFINFVTAELDQKENKTVHRPIAFSLQTAQLYTGL